MKTLIARIALLSALLLPPVAMADSGNVLRFDATQLQAAARSGFPVEHALLEGFASLTLTDPQVRIPVPGERLQLQMAELLKRYEEMVGQYGSEGEEAPPPHY